MPPHKPVALIVGASRGIGRQVAIDLSKNGYIAAKSTSDANSSSSFPPDPNSPASTINTVAREIQEAGGEVLPIQVDTRDHGSIARMVDIKFHRIDTLIYNSGAIWWASVANTPLSRFQLMQRVNPEGLYSVIQSCLPHFADNNWKGRIIVVCPPIYSRFFRGKTAYAMGKIGMSVLVKGLAMDWQREGKSDMAVTGIWPAVSIQSAATSSVSTTDPSLSKDLRHPTIFSDAILSMLRAPVNTVNGMLALDEDYLREYEGVTDFGKYSVVKGAEPRRIMPVKLPDLSVQEQDDEGRRTDSVEIRKRRAKL
ncbi:hypothetical protein B7494_g5583 [Chlorociboria aeruginascens]|nr:hypothetical protein B7494_g5583 [Chlorociboria aeruginascens]